MTNDNTAKDSSDNLEKNPQNAKNPPPPKKKKRHWLRIIAALLVLLVIGLILLVALIPTIASSGAVRNAVVEAVNKELNGKLEIKDWSLGWRSGIHVNGIRLLDASQKQILQINELSTDLSLIDAAKGNFHLGNTVIDGLDFFAERYPDGSLNFEGLAKPTEPAKTGNAPAPSSNAPAHQDSSSPADSNAAPRANGRQLAKVPVVDGTITISNCRGTFQNDVSEKVHKIVDFKTIAGQIKIPSLNDLITDNFKILAQMNDQTLLDFNTSGTSSIAKDNEILPPGQMKIDRTLQTVIDVALFQKGFGELANLDPNKLDISKGQVGVNLTVKSDGKVSAVKFAFNANGLTLTKGAGPELKKILDDYALGINVDASYSSDSPTSQHLTISRLLIGDDASKPSTMIGITNADNKPIEIITSADAPQGHGSIDIVRINLARLNEIAAAFSEATNKGEPGADLKSGMIIGRIDLGSDAKQLAIDGKLTLGGLTITMPDAQGLTNEQIVLDFSARAANNMTSATLPKFQVTGSVLTAGVSDAQIQLKNDPAAKDMLPPLKMLKHAIVSLNIPALEKVQALLDSVTPKPKKPAPAAVASAGPTTAPADEPPIKLAKGSISTKIELTGDASGLHINPTLDGKDVAISKGDQTDSIGNMAMVGQIALNFGQPKPSTQPSALDDLASVQFTDFAVLAVGSGLKLNGQIEDPLGQRNFKNVVADLTYNSGMLWNVILPLMSKDSQKSMKDAKIAGNYNKKWTFNGPFPGGQDLPKAISHFNLNGELALDLFDSQGATLKNFVIPVTIANGKLAFAYPEGSAKKYADPASLNGGTMSLAGISVDLTDPHMIASAPDGTKFLQNVGLNQLFASTFLGDDLNNPLFVGADKAQGLLSIEITRCKTLPTDDLVTKNDPANTGVLELNLKIQKLELGNALLAKLSSSLGPLKPLVTMAGGSMKLDNYHADVDEFNVVVQKGISTQKMTFTVGDQKTRGLKMNGTVTLATKIMDMMLTVPLSTFGVKGSGPENDLNIPMTGPVDKPNLKTDVAIKNAMSHIKGLPKIPGLFGDNKTPASTSPSSDQPGDKTTDLINGIFGKKKKDPSDQ